ncbi:MAG: sulfatase [Verrucomicrobiales bacterium]|nr:sulfatase [Verrucomicrobiales bacterium]|tara:strand:+ start:2100 stop:3539 length:1440 start_codon:yes stop_codon:yes gene_type:complete
MSHSPPNRRQFLADTGMGFTGLALGSLLAGEGISRADSTVPSGIAEIAPKAKSVIWLFMLGGTSHMESFDPKPALNQHVDKTFEETPFGDNVLNSPFYRKNVRDFAGVPRDLMPKIYPLQIGSRPQGQSGIEMSDWWPHLATCVDDLAIVRSMWTTDNDHAAQLQFHTGRHIFDGLYPSIGSWVHYGLGTANKNLPQFVVMGPPPRDCCGGVGAHGASYLGPEHAGVKISTDPDNPLQFGTPGDRVYLAERRQQLELLNDLHELTAVEYPNDATMRARIKSYELAFRMQMAVPDVVSMQSETDATKDLYGLDGKETRTFGQQCLIARRLVENGVRFVQLYHDGWDAHRALYKNHSGNTRQVDQPIAGLLKDLKQRGLLDETLVVWATEFGRTPGAQNADGRDHHPYGFSVWLAGGGIKGGMTHGATDELGFHAVENRHYVTDIHATVLHQLGLNPRSLEVPGHKRLEIDFGSPIREIIA